MPSLFLLFHPSCVALAFDTVGITKEIILMSPPARPPITQTEWVVQSDFDGTISQNDVTDSLLRSFGMPGWRALECAWSQRQIGSREGLSGQVALLDMSVADLHAHLDSVVIDAGFAQFVDVAQALGIQVQVVSDGLDHAIAHVLARHGLGDLEVIANRLVQVSERRWRVEFPWGSARCERASGNCKCERLTARQSWRQQVLYVGDGVSDFCVSGRADFVLAKDRLIAHCVEHGIAHATFRSFAQACHLLRTTVLERSVV